MTEIKSPLSSSALAFDPVVYGVAQGLSQLFPPVEHPNGLFSDEGALQEGDGVDVAS